MLQANLHGRMVDESWYRGFKSLYQQAVELEQEMFKVDGQDITVGYAKYVIEYLETCCGFKDN